MTTSSSSMFEPNTVEQLKSMKNVDGTFEGHRIHVYVEGFRGPSNTTTAVGAVVVSVGTQFLLKYDSITLELPVSKHWDEVFETFNASTSVFQVTGYELAEQIATSDDVEMATNEVVDVPSEVEELSLTDATASCDEFAEVKIPMPSSIIATAMEMYMKEAVAFDMAMKSGDVWFDATAQVVMVNITTGTAHARGSAAKMLGKMLRVSVVEC